MVKPGRYEEKKRGQKEVPQNRQFLNCKALEHRLKGGEQLRAELIEQINASLGTHHSGSGRIETTPANAEGILAHDLSRRVRTECELSNRRKRDQATFAMTRRLRNGRTMAWGS